MTNSYADGSQTLRGEPVAAGEDSTAESRYLHAYTTQLSPPVNKGRQRYTRRLLRYRVRSATASASSFQPFRSHHSSHQHSAIPFITNTLDFELQVVYHMLRTLLPYHVYHKDISKGPLPTTAMRKLKAEDAETQLLGTMRMTSNVSRFHVEGHEGVE